MAFEDLFENCIEYVEGLAKEALKYERVTVSVGGNPTYVPNEFIVREIVQNPEFSDRVTSVCTLGKAQGAYRVEFNVGLEAWSTKASLPVASADVQRWALLLVKAVAADKTLGGLVIHAEPYVTSSGTAKDVDGRKYIASIDFGIHIKAELDPAAN